MNDKHRCCQCNKIAIWVYIPATRNEYPYYCEEHVPRGCSCVEADDVDDFGRPFPCCEYQYSKDGWEAFEDEVVPTLEERLEMHRLSRS